MNLSRIPVNKGLLDNFIYESGLPNFWIQPSFANPPFFTLPSFSYVFILRVSFSLIGAQALAELPHILASLR